MASCDFGRNDPLLAPLYRTPSLFSPFAYPPSSFGVRLHVPSRNYSPIPRLGVVPRGDRRQGLRRLHDRSQRVGHRAVDRRLGDLLVDRSVRRSSVKGLRSGVRACRSVPQVFCSACVPCRLSAQVTSRFSCGSRIRRNGWRLRQLSPETPRYIVAQVLTLCESLGSLLTVRC